MTDREKEIMEAIFTMGLGRLDPEVYPQEEVDALIYRALHLLEAKEFDMPISTLKQEPCDDYTEGYFKGYDDGLERKLEESAKDAAISRKRALAPYEGLNDDDVISVRLIKKNITELPPVTPSRQKENNDEGKV